MKQQIFLVALTVMVGCSARNPTQSKTTQRPNPSSVARITEEGRSRAATADNGEQDHGPFFALLNWTKYNYQPLDFNGLLAESTLVVRGHITSVSDGRTMDYVSGPSGPLYTSVVEFRVDQALKGIPESSSVYVEFIRAPIVSSAELASTFPGQQQMMLFLIPAYWNYSHYKYIGASSGRPEGATLYTLRTPQGLVTNGSGSRPLEQPLEGAVPFVAGSVRTLDQLAENVQGTALPSRQSP